MTREATKAPSAAERDRPTGRCPVCGRPRVQRFRPFCSAACRDRDFLAWVEGRYALPALEEEPGEEAPAAGAGRSPDPDGSQP